MGMGSYDESEQNDQMSNITDNNQNEEDQIERKEGEVKFNEASVDELMDNFNKD